MYHYVDGVGDLQKAESFFASSDIVFPIKIGSNLSVSVNMCITSQAWGTFHQLVP